MLAVLENLLIFGGVAAAILCLAGTGYYAEQYWAARHPIHNDAAQEPILADPISEP